MINQIKRLGTPLEVIWHTPKSIVGDWNFYALRYQALKALWIMIHAIILSSSASSLALCASFHSSRCRLHSSLLIDLTALCFHWDSITIPRDNVTPSRAAVSMCINWNDHSNPIQHTHWHKHYASSSYHIVSFNFGSWWVIILLFRYTAL